MIAERAGEQRGPAGEQLPLAAFDAGREVADVMKEKRWTDWTPFSYPFNLTQQPAASIPCGLTRDGLPVGLQIVGPRYADALVLRAARAYESARPIALPDLAKLAPRPIETQPYAPQPATAQAPSG